MLSGIFSKKSDHPMADIKSAQAFLEDLPKNDVHKLLMELTEWIESVSDNDEIKLDQQFAVLCLLDEAAQSHIRKLSREYFTPNELGKFQENRMWLSLGNLSRHTAEGYLKIFDRYCSAEKGGNTIKAKLPLLLVRAVSSMAVQLKFISVRYGYVDKALWTNLAKILSHAELQECMDTPVNLYPSLIGNTSVKYEIGHLLGWFGCGVNTLKPLYMHLTERLVAQYSMDIDIHPILNENDLFSFDLNCPSAPMRVKVDASTSPSMRFVNMTAMKPKLETLIQTLRKKVIPGELTMGVGYSPELMLDAAKYLLNYIISPPIRRSVRRSVKINMNVEQGFANTIDRTNAGLNFDQKKPLQWQIEDISANGFRTVLPSQLSDDIRIGSLLGVQPTGMQNWGVAVVRRMMRDEKNQLHVGAEMLTNQVAPVALVQGGKGGSAFEDGQTALWLYEKPGELEGGARLLMRTDAYASDCSLLSEFNGEDYLLIPVQLLERCLDCDLVQFRLIKQEGSSGHF